MAEQRANRVLLVFPIFSHVLPDAFGAFAAALLTAARRCPSRQFDVFVAERELLHSAMNRAATVVRERPAYEAMIAFDDDCLPPQTAIPRLLAHLDHGYPMVAGYSYMRRFPHTTTVARLLPEGPSLRLDPVEGAVQVGFEWLDDLDAVPRNPDGLIPVGFCGFPIVAVRRDVLERVEWPPFGHEDRTGASMTHDVFFCQRVRDAGLPIYVDPAIECGHLAPPPIITRASRARARAAVAEARGRPDADAV